MSLFGERLDAQLTYMGLRQMDLAGLVNRTTLNGYLKGKTPTWESGIELLSALCLNMEYMSNPDETEPWNATIRKLRGELRTWARTVPGELDAFQRTLAVINAITERLPQAQAYDWFIPGILNFGGMGAGDIPGAERNKELYQQYINGECNSSTMRHAVRRLSDFTQLPSAWIQLGRERLLDPATSPSSEEWMSFVAQAERLGHTVKMYKQNLETFHELFQSLRLLH